MKFLGLSLWKGTYSGFLKKILHPKKSTLIFTPNPEMLLRASEDDEFLDILRHADYLVPDGNGLYLVSLMQRGKSYFSAGIKTFFDKKYCQKNFGELIKGSDLTSDLFLEYQKLRVPVLILDRRVVEIQSAFDTKKAHIQKSLKQLLEEKYPGLEVYILFEGDMMPDGIAHYIELQKIRCVFSTLGMKSQEKILLEIFSYLPKSQKVIGLGVGASIDFLLGLQKRAPIFFQELGIEWLYRLILDPKKRWKRIWSALREFPKAMINEKK